jgi:hypothetical protein
MSSTHYLINHSRKEFYSFDNKIDEFKLLEILLNTIYSKWETTDNIIVDSEYSNIREYTNLDYIDAEYMTEFIPSKFFNIL